METSTLASPCLQVFSLSPSECLQSCGPNAASALLWLLYVLVRFSLFYNLFCRTLTFEALAYRVQQNEGLCMSARQKQAHLSKRRSPPPSPPESHWSWLVLDNKTSAYNHRLLLLLWSTAKCLRVLMNGFHLTLILNCTVRRSCTDALGWSEQHPDREWTETARCVIL